jgi:SAM-dependent methyltransferase
MRHLQFLGKTAVALAVVALAAFAVIAADDKKDDLDREPDVIYLPTPQAVVEKMLELAKVTKKDLVYDLGCGDARIPLTAARKYGCKAKGFDINPERIKDSMANWKKEKKEVQDLVKVERKDIFKLDISDANVVTLYLLPTLNVKLVPQLKKLKPGSRIVSHAFDMRGYKPDKKETVTVKDDEGTERPFDIYLWTIPLKEDKDAKDD